MGRTQAGFRRDGQPVGFAADCVVARSFRRVGAQPGTDGVRRRTTHRGARLQLARSQAAPDLQWQVGVRRLQETGDAALVAGLSMPLGSRSRAQPQIHAAEAELEALSIGRSQRPVAVFHPGRSARPLHRGPSRSAAPARRRTACWPRPNTRPSVPIAPAQSATSNGHNCNLNRRSRVSSNSTSPCKLSSPSLKSSGSPASPGGGSRCTRTFWRVPMNRTFVSALLFAALLSACNAPSPSTAESEGPSMVRSRVKPCRNRPSLWTRPQRHRGFV